MDRSDLVVLLEMVEILCEQLESGELPRDRSYVFEVPRGKFRVMTHDELRRAEAAETEAWLQNSAGLQDTPVRQLRVPRLNN